MAGTSNKPFVLPNEVEICELIDDSGAENTKKTIIRYGISRMNSFAVCADETCDLELDNFLPRFYAELQKDDGIYTPQNPCTRFATAYKNISNRSKVLILLLTSKHQFVQSNKVFKEVLVKLNKEGKSVVKHNDSISKDDMTKIVSFWI